jgi:hypothetical protein
MIKPVGRTSLLYQNSFLLIAGYWLIFIILSFIVSFSLTDEQLYIEHFSEALEYERIMEILSNQRKYVWIEYLLRIVYFSIKFLILCLVILAGLFAWNIKLNFKTILNIVIVSESVFFFKYFSKISLVWVCR